jgi:hypothetical protein
MVKALLAGRSPTSPLQHRLAPALEPAREKTAAQLCARLVARFGSGLDLVIRRRPVGSRPGARLVGADSDGVGAAAAGLPTRDGGGASQATVLELELPAGGLRGLFSPCTLIVSCLVYIVSICWCLVWCPLFGSFAMFWGVFFAAITMLAIYGG